MRGKARSLNFALPDVRTKWAKFLVDLGASAVLLDCMRPILDALGLSEDKDAGKFLTGFDVMPPRRSSPTPWSSTIWATRVNEREVTPPSSAGATRYGRWFAKDEDPASQRYFSAFGRDVDV